MYVILLAFRYLFLIRNLQISKRILVRKSERELMILVNRNSVRIRNLNQLFVGGYDPINFYIELYEAKIKIKIQN